MERLGTNCSIYCDKLTKYWDKLVKYWGKLVKRGDFGFWILDIGYWMLLSPVPTLRNSELDIGCLDWKRLTIRGVFLLSVVLS